MLRHKPAPPDDEPVSGFMPGMSESKKKKGIMKLFSRRKSSSFKIQDATYSEPVRKKSQEKTHTEQRLAAIEMQLSEQPGNSSQKAPANTQAPANQRPVSQGPPKNQKAAPGPPKERPVSGGPPVNQRQRGKAPVSPGSSMTLPSPMVKISQRSSHHSSQNSTDSHPSTSFPLQTSTPVPTITLNNNHPLTEVPIKAPRKKRLAPPPPPQPPSTSSNDDPGAVCKDTVTVSSPAAPKVEPRPGHIEVTTVTIEPNKNGHVKSNETSVEQVPVVQTNTTVKSESNEIHVEQVPAVQIKTAVKSVSNETSVEQAPVVRTKTTVRSESNESSVEQAPVVRMKTAVKSVSNETSVEQAPVVRKKTTVKSVSNESSVEQAPVVRKKTTVKSEVHNESQGKVNAEDKTDIKTATPGKSDTLKRKRRAPAPPAPSPSAAAAAGSASESQAASAASPQSRTSAPPLNFSLSSSSSQSDGHESERQSPGYDAQSENDQSYGEQEEYRPLPHFVAPPPPRSPPPPLSPATRDYADLSGNTSRVEKVSPETIGSAVTTITITDSYIKETPPSPEIRTNAVTEFKSDVDTQGSKGKSSKAKMDGRDSDSESSSDTSSVMAYDVNVSIDEPPVPGIDDGVILTGKRVFEEEEPEGTEMSSPTFQDDAMYDPPRKALPSPVPPFDALQGSLDSSEIIFDDNVDIIYVSPEERTRRTNTDESSTDPIESPTSIGDEDRDDIFERTEITVTRGKQDDSAYASFNNGNTTLYPGKEIENQPTNNKPMVTNLRQLYRGKPPSRVSEPSSPSAYDLSYNTQRENTRAEERYSLSPDVPSVSSESSVSPDPVTEESYETTSVSQTWKWKVNEEDTRQSQGLMVTSFKAPNLPVSPPPPPPPSGLGGSALKGGDIDVNNVWDLIEEKKILPVESQRSDISDTYKENQGDSYNINIGVSHEPSPREYETSTYRETTSVTSPSWNQPAERSPSFQEQKIREETRRWSALVGPQGYMKQHQAFSFAHPETENESLLEEKSVSLLRSPGQDTHDEILKERYDDLQKKFHNWEQQLKENQALISKKVMTKSEADKHRSNRDIEMTHSPVASGSVPFPPAPPPVAPPPPVSPVTSTPKAPANRASRLHSAPEPTRQDSSGGLAGRFSPAELVNAKANLRNSQVSEFDPSVRNSTLYTSPSNTRHSSHGAINKNEQSSLKKKTTANGSAFRSAPRSQSVSSNRFDIKMDPREELMIAIRNAGGRGGLKRVPRR